MDKQPAKPFVASRALARLRELADHVGDGGNVTDQFKVTTVKIDDDGTVNRRVSEPATKRPPNRAGERREP